MTTAGLKCAAILAVLAVGGAAQAADWAICGQISQINAGTCQLPNYPSTSYEYGIAYNSREPLRVVCTFWNKGARIANKEPYLIYSDNPLAGMRYGGFVFYQGTNASDDDCRDGYRHHYWRLTTNTAVETAGGNGCYWTVPIYCQRR